MAVKMMDFCSIIFTVFAVILLLGFVFVLRIVYVLKKKSNNAPLDRRKPVKVMVVAGSGMLKIYFLKPF